MMILQIYMGLVTGCAAGCLVFFLIDLIGTRRSSPLPRLGLERTSDSLTQPTRVCSLKVRQAPLAKSCCLLQSKSNWI